MFVLILETLHSAHIQIPDILFHGSGPVRNWQPAWGVPLPSHYDSWVRLQQTTLNSGRGRDTGWMDGWMKVLLAHKLSESVKYNVLSDFALPTWHSAFRVGIGGFDQPVTLGATRQLQVKSRRQI